VAVLLGDGSREVHISQTARPHNDSMQRTLRGAAGFMLSVRRHLSDQCNGGTPMGTPGTGQVQFSKLRIIGAIEGDQ
jgi:hypothetical protein